MKKIVLNDLIMNIVKITDYDKEIVKEILGHIIPEINFQLLQGHKFSLPWIVALHCEPSSDKLVYSVHEKKFKKNVNTIKVKAVVSRSIKEKVNYNKKRTT